MEPIYMEIGNIIRIFRVARGIGNATLQLSRKSPFPRRGAGAGEALSSGSMSTGSRSRETHRHSGTGPKRPGLQTEPRGLLRNWRTDSRSECARSRRGAKKHRKQSAARWILSIVAGFPLRAFGVRSNAWGPAEEYATANRRSKSQRNVPTQVLWRRETANRYWYSLHSRRNSVQGRLFLTQYETSELKLVRKTSRILPLPTLISYEHLVPD